MSDGGSERMGLLHRPEEFASGQVVLYHEAFGVTHQQTCGQQPDALVAARTGGLVES